MHIAVGLAVLGLKGTDVVESLAALVGLTVDISKRIVLPIYIFGIRIAGILLEFGSYAVVAIDSVIGVSKTVTYARHYVDIMLIISGVLLFESVPELLSLDGAAVAAIHSVIFACTGAIEYIGTVLGSKVIQRLTSGDRAYACKIVGIIA